MTFYEMGLVISKTIICYFFLIFTLKIMGKREVGKLSTFDIVVFFVISELFSLSLNEPDSSILRSLVPVTIIVLLQLGTALIVLKFPASRRLMEGKPTYLIYNGEIVQKEMKRARYTVGDLMVQLRNSDIKLPNEVAFALLENSGVLNVIKKKGNNLIIPEPLISDGKVSLATLKRLGKDEKWLRGMVSKVNASYEIKDIFMALLTTSGLNITMINKNQININKIKN